MKNKTMELRLFRKILRNNPRQSLYTVKAFIDEVEQEIPEINHFTDIDDALAFISDLECGALMAITRKLDMVIIPTDEFGDCKIFEEKD